MTILTEAQRKKYIESGGVFCPYCGSHDIEGNSDNSMDGGEVLQSVDCNACGENWTDVYTLSAIYSSEDDKENQ